MNSPHSMVKQGGNRGRHARCFADASDQAAQTTGDEPLDGLLPRVDSDWERVL